MTRDLRSVVSRFVAGVERVNWLLIPFLAVPALWPLRALELPQTYDGFLHFLRLIALDAHIAQGNLYPRWIPELFGGLGYPVFNFYSPATYYLAEIFVLLGASYGRALVATMAVLVTLAGFGMYCLALDFLTYERTSPSRWGALIAAAAYMIAPYLMTNVYVRGAIAELGAQALFPWIAWSFRRLLSADEPTPYLFLASFSLGGLALTHNISLLLLPPVLVGYVIVLWWQCRSQPDVQPKRLRWVAAAVLFAMGISAFFWMPLIGERSYLADSAYTLSAARIPEHVWTLTNFLDFHWPFEYTGATPYQLGVVQLGLGIAGFLMLKERRVEAWYWAILALALGVATFEALLPFWLSSDILLIVQFPWRLLTMISLPLALFTGGIVQRARSGMAAAWMSLLLIAVLVTANFPKIDWLQTLVMDHMQLGVASIAQHEADAGTRVQDPAHDFMPRWVFEEHEDPRNAARIDARIDAPAPADPDVRLLAAGPHLRQFAVSAPEPATVSLTDLYFPGWEATLDGTQPLELRPGADRGLLTFDLPAGDHTVLLVWAGTQLQRWGRAITLTSLLLLGLYLLSRRNWRVLALAPFALLLFGLVGTLLPLPSVQAQPLAARPETTHGLRLLGYTVRQPDAAHLEISPFWYVASPPPDLRFRWRLLDDSGALLSAIDTYPYYNSARSDEWLAGWIVDDKYLMALPPGLEVGSYDLELQIAPVDPGSAPDSEPLLIGGAAIDAPPPPQEPIEGKLGLRFGDELLLDGFELKVNGRSPGNRAPTGAGNPVVKPGDTLDYLLRWRALEAAREDYHGFVHLVDAEKNVLSQQDQLPGPRLAPPMSWNAFYPATDLYRLKIPEDARSGLYTPRIGLYRFETGNRLPITQPDGSELGDGYNLPSIKVLDDVDARAENPIGAIIDGVGKLAGYTLDLPEAGVRPGSALTLTLIYQSDSAPHTNYTQFVHLYNSELGMAAQVDAEPQRGGNPTSAWVPGEVVKEEIPLVIFPDAQPGSYALKVGLYDAHAGGARLSVTDRRGQPASNGEIVLTTIEVAP